MFFLYPLIHYNQFLIFMMYNIKYKIMTIIMSRKRIIINLKRGLLIMCSILCWNSKNIKEF